jgi:hypothetical protein
VSIKTYKLVIYGEDANANPFFLGFADKVEEARKFKVDAESAGFTHVAVVDGNLRKVELTT